MRRRRCCWWRRIEKRFIGFLILLIGIAALAIIILPVTAWILLAGCICVYIGYKLFCGY